MWLNKSMDSIIVSIIIVNYNRCDLLIDCINSIYDQTKDVGFEIIVVDNASNDGSEIKVKENFSEIIFIQSEENLGFGRANNLGIQRAVGKYVLLLNSDTILLNNSIKAFLDFHEKKSNNFEKIGAIGGELLKIDKVSRNHSSQYFPKMMDEFKTIINALFFKLSKKIAYKFKDEAILTDTETYKEVDYVTGADLFILKSLILEFGCFDNNFFMYFEETDLQKRLVNAGYRNYLISGTKIIHYEGASFNNKVSGNRVYMLDQSRFYYYKKHESAIFYIAFRFLYFIVTLPLLFDFRLSYSIRVKLFLLRLGLRNRTI
jgi:GT2 family glycosyltransferase